MKLAQADLGLTTIQQSRSPDENLDLLQYQGDPVGFIQDILGGFSWSKQREVAESVRDHRMTAVHSCHGTGKSKIAARICCWWLGAHAPGDAFVVTTAPSEPQVKAILWREINREFRAANGKLPGRCFTTHWSIGEELVAIGRKPGDLDMTAFQGLHAKNILVVMDESCGISSSIWAGAETLITSEDSRLLAIGNPDDSATEFGRSCRVGSGYNVIHIAASMSPNFTGEAVPEDLRKLLVSPTWVGERKTRWGEDSPMYISKVLGRFPEMASDALFSQTWIRAAIDRELPPDENDSVLGVDIARFGNDSSVGYLRRGNVARRILTLHNRDLMYVAGSILQKIDEFRPGRVNIDDAGLGGGVTDRLREIMRERRAGRMRGHICLIVGINVGESATDTLIDSDGTLAKDKFVNLRGELHWGLRERFREGLIDLDGDEEDVQAQLGAIKYTVDSRGRIIPEPKADMKKRGLPSPDDADALMLAFAPTTLKTPMQISDDMLTNVRRWLHA